MTRTSLAQRILTLLERRGQMHMRHLEAALDLEYVTIGDELRRLIAAHQVAVLGKAGEAGYTDAQSTAPVYGLAGSTLKRVERKPRKSRSNGSGHIAGPITIGSGHRWGSTRL